MRLGSRASPGVQRKEDVGLVKGLQGATQHSVGIEGSGRSLRQAGPAGLLKCG